jgi:SAM-dependent methyltransferase
MQSSLKKLLVDHASAPYRCTGRFNYYWARGKLAGDPIFAALLDEGVFADDTRILDLGCGRGLLAAWILAAERLAAGGEWTAATPPRGLRFRGVELMAREAACGNRALQPLFGTHVALSGGDMCLADLGGVDAIAILDALHYIPPDAQELLLDRIRAALGGGGLFVTRVGNADGGWRFAASQIVDRCMSFAQGHRLARMWCRSLTDWIGALERRGFVVRAVPMSQGTPFANVMLICRLP